MFLASEFFTWNLLVIGSVRGLIYALIAMGIVLVYRSTRVINFAVGDLGVPAAGLLGVMAGAHGWPYWLALVAALFVGTFTGAVVELSVIRRLFRAPRVIVLVATIGVAQLMLAITLTLPEYRTGSLSGAYPVPFKTEWHLPGDVILKPGQIMALIIVPLVTLGLWWLLGHTSFGESVRASVGNPDLARLTGINPKLISTAVWAIGGFLSALAVILIATESTSSDIVSVGPKTLLLGLTAALAGRMTSFPKAVVAAIFIGVVDQVLIFNYTDQTGLVQFILFLAVVVLVSRRSRSDDVGTESFQFSPRHHVVSERLQGIWWVRRLPQFVGLFGLLVAIAVPLLITESAKHLTYAEVLAFALCAISVTVLTGWGGQLSLGQMAFAGVGALTAAALIRGTDFTVGLWGYDVFSATTPEVPFGWALLLGAIIACLTATIIGITALRVRGLMLAASTLAFAIAAQLYIFRQPVLSQGRQTVRLPRDDIGPFDLTHKNLGYYYFVLTLLVIVLIVVGRLRRSGIGRTIIGVRENERAAEAFTVSPTRAKLTAYALGGFIAGLGGALLGGLVVTVGFTEKFFRVEDSFALVSIAVIGGLGSTAGAVLGAIWVIGLPAFWPDNDVVPLFTSSIGLLLILLYIPGGFTQITYWIRDVVFARIEKRLGPAPPKQSVEPPSSLRLAAAHEPVTTNPNGSVLATTGLVVRFGGLTAVNDVDFRAMPNQVVGLIGANGAGKSTLLNAIGGYLPSSGRVELLGRDISNKSASQRASRGLGRTFQAAMLFPELTVREVVELALEARERTSFWSTALFLPRSGRLEKRRRAEAAELIDFLGLGRYADRFVAELSTGTRRIVELAALLGVAPRVICLDEPTAGVAQREAEAFGPLIKRLQHELDATLVVVEHDLPLILAITDYVYCLEAGSVIASGEPEQMRVNPLVVASYLGTDERATMRSNAALTD
jgi:ABC-type branched-subunit amino acid transport system ATPase component/ABC-type branched-subunit amino acid transport system permease subunit